jgi:formiminotetrahydrofolate cyclodeaminase
MSLKKASFKSLSVDNYLKDLASDKPVPGGGAAVALVAAQATALLSMVLAVSGENPQKLPLQRHEDLTKSLEKARNRLVDLGDKDAEAFELVMAGFRLPKDTPEEKASRTAALQAAYKAATEVPFATMETIAEILSNAGDVVRAGKATVISDAAIGIDFLHSSLKACRHNVRINLKYIKDDDFRDSAEARMKALTSGRKKLRKNLQTAIQEMLTSR